MRVGLLAGFGSWIGMALLGLVGVSLLGIGTSSLPAAVTLAVGGAARVDLGAFGIQVGGPVDLMPLGLSLVGAVLLAAPLRRRAELPWAAGAFGLGLVVMAALPADPLEVRFWPTLLGGALWLGAVLGIRVLTWTEPTVRHTVKVLLGVVWVAMVAGLAVAVFGGARVVGTVLLGGPNLLFVALTRGLGTPWATETGRLPMAQVDAGELQPLDVPVWPLTVVAVVVVVLCAVRGRRAWVAAVTAGVAFGGMAWLAGVEVAVTAEAQGRTMFDATIAASGNGWVAAGVAALGSLLVAGAATWHRQRT